MIPIDPATWCSLPNRGASERIVKALAKLKNAKEYTDASLDFLKNYTYTLGVSDLIPYGARQSRAAGATVFQRYSNLVSDSCIPFIRVSDGRRVVDTAKNWTAGFSVASKYKYQPRINVFISELDDRNNTLDDIMCPNAGGPDDYTDAWSQVFATPIADRLNSHAPGANLDPLEIYNLMALCAFETLVNGKESHFCPLFTKSEFDQFEYFYDLDKYYGTGYGQELGPVQGVGYVNELLARLTRSPVRDETQTNRTLTGSPLTFPLDRTIYADFSHDNQMIAIFSALGLFKQPQDLDPRNPDPKRTWIISHLTPFNGMMVTERLQCKSKTRSGTYVRILVNDALQPLEFCGADKIGLCDLDSFVRSQAYARENGRGDFEKCFD